jgi:hypothetical protein
MAGMPKADETKRRVTGVCQLIGTSSICSLPPCGASHKSNGKTLHFTLPCRTNKGTMAEMPKADETKRRVRGPKWTIG